MSDPACAVILPTLHSRLRKNYWRIGLTLLLGAVSILPAEESTAPAGPPAGTLTNIAQLRALSPTAAAQQFPVQFRATVTAMNPPLSIFVQDATGGTFINGARPAFATLQSGDVLEITGVSYPGRFVSGITPGIVRQVGRTTLPEAVPVTFEDLTSARRHYERVVVSGIVRAVNIQPENRRSVLTLALGVNKLEALIVAPAATNLPALVDARVRLAGLAAGYINERRQLLAPQLFVSRMQDIQVEQPPLEDPFAAPLTAATALLNFTPGGVSPHRVRVQGQVTHHQPGEMIFLRQDGSGLMVQTKQATAVQPGDLIEAVGFPSMGRFSAQLENAEFRITGHAAAPAPVPTTIGAALGGTNDADLVVLNAQLFEVLETRDETLLVLGAESSVLRARLPRTPVSFRNGSQLRLTGVCWVVAPILPAGNFGASPGAIELLLRSVADVEVLESPSWWTARRLAIAAAILLGLALTGFGWVGLLRRRVLAQSRIIHEKVQREAVLEERHRMAREIHDTMAQSFSGLGFQLEALKTRLPPEAENVRPQLETAHQMVRHGQESFRRSLLNLRAPELERGSLAEALPEIARQIIGGTDIELRCAVAAPPRALPEAVESNLLRIGQECLFNAVQHGKPRRIELALTPLPGALQLRIADNGRGFDPGHAHPNGNNHFGLRGIRERAEQIAATLQLDSQPGRGTVVTVTVPLPS